jgi:hypothetical protein
MISHPFINYNLLLLTDAVVILIFVVTHITSLSTNAPFSSWCNCRLSIPMQ